MAMTATCTRTGLHSGTSPVADAGLPTISDTAIGPTDLTRDVVLPPDLQRADASPPVDALANMDGVGSGTVDALCDLYKASVSVSEGTEPLGLSCSLSTQSDFDANYAVVVDGEGRFVELLRMPAGTPALTGSARQAWLDSVANDRWPCLAGQTVFFSCQIGLN